MVMTSCGCLHSKCLSAISAISAYNFSRNPECVPFLTEMFVTLVLTSYCELKGKTNLFASKKVGFNHLQTHNVFLPLPKHCLGHYKAIICGLCETCCIICLVISKASFEDEENNGGVINQESFSLGDIT